MDFVSNRTEIEIDVSDDDSVFSEPAEIFPSLSRDFVWTTDVFQPKIYQFDDTNSGCKIESNEDNSVLKYFEYFFDQEIMEMIASETNKYYEYLSKQEHSEFSRMRRWQPVEYKELYCFFAVALLMPHSKKK